MIIIKIILLGTLLAVFAQDAKERLVHWILFPLIAICSGILMYKDMFLELFITTIGFNLGFVFILILTAYLYSNYKLNKNMKQSFAIGDVFMCIALAFTFSTFTFWILFVFALLFSLGLHLVVNKKSKFKTVPLAGYLSLFFAITYISYWSGIIKSVYTL